MTAAATRPAQETESRAHQVRAPMDLIRVDNYIVMMVSLPGLKPADFRISLVGDRQLYLEGTAHYRNPVPREALTLSERPYGTFQRTINMPFPITSQGGDLRLVDGVLTAHLPIRRQPLSLQWVAPAELQS